MTQNQQRQQVSGSGVTKGNTDTDFLEQMSYVDMDLVDAAGEDRRRPPLDRNRWPRRILTRVAVALITLTVVMGLVFTMKEQMQWNTPALDGGGSMVDYVDLICYEGQIYYLTEAPETDAVGEKIGEVGVSWVRYPEPDPQGRISATVLSKNAPVHVWEGYDLAERLCAQRDNGQWVYYVWRYDWAEEEAEREASREPLDIKEGSLNESTQENGKETESAGQETADTVFYLGGTYTRYVGRDILGGAQMGIPIGTLTTGAEKGIGIHPTGTQVYEWSGYDPWYRISIRGAGGGNYYYERWTEEELAHLTMTEFLPKDEQVTAISIYKKKGTRVGQITDPQEIARLLAQFRTDAVFGDGKGEEYITEASGRYVDLVLENGSIMTITVYEENRGYCLRELRLPDGWVDALRSYEIYEIDESLGSTDYGSPLAARWARPSVRQVEPWEDGETVYTVGGVWLDGNRLCMGWSNSYGPRLDLECAVLAEDVAGDLRVEDMEIWYRTIAGDVAYMYFWYPYDSGRFYEDLEKQADFSQYIKEHTTLYKGPFVKVQVRDGQVWTLDEKGILRRENEKIAAGVTCFVLDASGTIYGTEEGLYRRVESTGEVVSLAAGNVTAVSSAEMMVCYALASGQVRSVWLDGTKDRLVCEAAAVNLKFDRMGEWRFLLLTDEQGTLWSVQSTGELLPIAEHVVAVQLVENRLWVCKTEGSRGEEIVIEKIPLSNLGRFDFGCGNRWDRLNP